MEYNYAIFQLPFPVQVVYVTATLPYVLLLVILIRGLTLPGSLDGVLFYITPDFERLKDGKVKEFVFYLMLKEELNIACTETHIFLPMDTSTCTCMYISYDIYVEGMGGSSYPDFLLQWHCMGSTYNHGQLQQIPQQMLKVHIVFLWPYCVISKNMSIGVKEV